MVEHALGLADMFLIMSVNPGFGGQKFIPYSVTRFGRRGRSLNNRGYRCVIEVDGGIDSDTMQEVLKAGAEILVAGSAIFHDPDPARKIKEMLEIAARVGYHSNYV